MKKQIITVGVVAIFLSPNVLYGANAIMYCASNKGGNTDTCPDCTIVTQTIMCGTETYCDCSACVNNATPTERTIQTGAYSYSTISECPKSFSGEIIVGGTCPDTCPDSTWTDVDGTNYQTRCGGSILNPSCEYQCRVGFYGTGTSCTQCPSWSGIYADTALTLVVRGTGDAGATAISGCYIPVGAYYDVPGAFKLLDNCAYSN
ncbi:MAG: hypothetical protein NC311_03990 [Muribaculaceae bacterium]|nr:hypothetical protein [Muribaculaceae bacterium]